MSEYGPDDMHVLDDAVAFIRRHPHMFLGDLALDDPALPAYLTEHVSDQSAILGASVFATAVDDYQLLCCVPDWLPPDVSTYFTRLLPFPERGPNSFHSTVLLTAFASTVFTQGRTEDRASVISGALPESVQAVVAELLTRFDRVIGFAL